MIKRTKSPEVVKNRNGRDTNQVAPGLINLIVRIPYITRPRQERILVVLLLHRKFNVKALQILLDWPEVYFSSVQE